jgi:hypothetical protein
LEWLLGNIFNILSKVILFLKHPNKKSGPDQNSILFIERILKDVKSRPLRNLNSNEAFSKVEFFFGNRVGWAVWEIVPSDAKAEVKTKPTLFLPFHDL